MPDSVRRDKWPLKATEDEGRSDSQDEFSSEGANDCVVNCNDCVIGD